MLCSITNDCDDKGTYEQFAKAIFCCKCIESMYKPFADKRNHHGCYYEVEDRSAFGPDRFLVFVRILWIVGFGNVC
ncbi:hypothetical protein D3C73_1350190 [compost metagenome]